MSAHVHRMKCYHFAAAIDSILLESIFVSAAFILTF